MILILERNMFYKRTVIYSLRIRINYLSKYKYLLIYCNKLINLSYFLLKFSNNKIIFFRYR